MHRSEVEPNEKSPRYMKTEGAFSRQQKQIMEKMYSHVLHLYTVQYSTPLVPSSPSLCSYQLQNTEATCGISAEMLVRGLAPWTLLWLSAAEEASVNSMGRKQRQWQLWHRLWAITYYKFLYRAVGEVVTWNMKTSYLSFFASQQSNAAD